MTTDEAMTEFVKPYLKRIRLLVDTLNARERTLFLLFRTLQNIRAIFSLRTAGWNHLH